MKATNANSDAITVCTKTALLGTLCLFTLAIAAGSFWSSPETKTSRANEKLYTTVMNRKKAASRIATSLLTRPANATPTAVASAVTCADCPSAARDRHHHCPGRQQVGRHHGHRSPHQVASDRALILDLDAHVEGHFYAQEGQHHQSEELQLVRLILASADGAHADQSVGSIAAAAPPARCTTPARTASPIASA